MKFRYLFLRNFLICTLIIVHFGCNNKKVEESKSTFSCIINGKPFYPKKISNVYFSAFIGEELGDNFFFIKAENDKERDISLNISINNQDEIIDVGEYKISQYDINLDDVDSIKSQAICFYRQGDIKIKEDRTKSRFESSNDKSGFIKITEISYEVPTRVKGVFSMTLINDFGEELVITDGKFDTHFK